ncbi:hypothetical protein ESCO_003865 [Escovopsis weberi]|uniref:Uncharacterized protein n=1 Tax=Escovopsis weberi TaxID=150374 RepID=A0A0M9VX49_ESCWE|nr:hypothetical protein ESCO_003865 [Escovopsis weberi]
MPARKRAKADDGQRRRSSRASALRTSTYFEGSEAEDAEDGTYGLGSGREGGFKQSAPPAGRKRKRAGVLRDAMRDALREQPAPGQRKTITPKKTVRTASELEGQDDDAAADDDDEDDDEDEDEDVRKVVILPLEKLRDEGPVGYAPQRLHRNTLLFLGDLKRNNERAWLKGHDGEYRRALRDWQVFVEASTQTVIAADETVPELPVQDVIFRIHRDIRFSKDPTPYKPHFSAAWSRTGRKGPYAAYYLHCEPGKCFVAGGLWQPEAAHLAALRASIDASPRRWRRVLRGAAFRAAFLPARDGDHDDENDDDDQSDDGERAVRAFVARNQGNALKKRPMGYDISHPDIELLRLRSFTVSAALREADLCSDRAQGQLGAKLRALEPFITFLNSIVMPDPNLDDGDGDEDDASEASPDEDTEAADDEEDDDDDDDDEMED